MNTNDREDALARALDLLADGDPSRADPRLVRDPALAAEARAARETAAEVWLAVAPLRAAPAEVLPEILSKIAPAPASSTHRLRTVFAIASGWAAAAVITLAWVLRTGGEESPPPSAFDRRPADPAMPQGRPSVRPAIPEAMPVRRTDRDRLHDELAQLRRALAAERNSSHAALGPRVMELTAPGSFPAADPDATKARLLAVLANALRGSLEAHAANPATLVIERGWLPDGQLHLADDQWVRHRNFPLETWGEHALLKSDDGRFYDPASGLLWEKDPASTDFIGRRPLPETDLAGFFPAGDPTTPTQPVLTQSAPAGFLIEDPASGEAQLVVEGLRPLSTDEVAGGSSYYFVANSASNGWLNIPVNLDHSDNQLGATTVSFNAAGGLTDYAVVLSDGRGGETVIITGGK